MATLILTAVGGAIGGPVGGAIGGLLGNAIDRAVLLKPAGRQGPRLTELKLQTSSYGTAIPRLYGTMRVAGTVVWATDLKESRTRSGGGKGRPSTTTYSYSASFAVLLSARPVIGVGRIWADGQLLRGSAGDLKVATGFRLHPGDERQDPDPLIAAAEAGGQAPAMRGQAYAVFEDLQLADYGNRIPSLTFEVIADPGPIATGAIAADLGVGAEAPGRLLGGFSVHGDSVRGVLETLAEVDGGWFAAGAAGPEMRFGAGPAVEIVDDGAGADARGTARGRTLAAAQDAPRALALAHYDPARDYQTGVQRAARPGAGTREARIDLPAALDAGAARAVAEGMLARAHARRDRRTVTLRAGAGLALRPGARVTVAGESGSWRIARWTLERLVVRLDLERIARAPLAAPASAGRVSPAPDRVHGPTILHAFELPPRDDAVLGAPRLTVAAAGGPGWRRAALLLSGDGGASWSAAGGANVPATLGVVTAPPGPGGALLIDLRASIEVELAHAGMALAEADDRALDAGANLALVGDELIQFGRAMPVAPRRWRLSRLLRGRRGTEWAADGHAAGERFVLLEDDALVTIDLPLAMLGGSARVLASGVGDGSGPAAATAGIAGASLRPPAPVGLGWTAAGDGGAVLRWIRRSRAGWRWLDGGDVPLAEEGERYRVEIGGRVETVAVPAAAVTAAERAAGPVTVRVRQLGTYAESVAATIVVPAA